mmetsp:Transcript_31665/g.67452  ORF Transcript_31665/g.67452 Transcript_31665/m.67452 type:complete len:131 (-) Transcript_31665:293-685(-)
MSDEATHGIAIKNWRGEGDVNANAEPLSLLALAFVQGLVSSVLRRVRRAASWRIGSRHCQGGPYNNSEKGRAGLFRVRDPYSYSYSYSSSPKGERLPPSTIPHRTSYAINSNPFTTPPGTSRNPPSVEGG